MAALELSGRLLGRVTDVFRALAGAHTNPALLEIERDIAPRRARHWDGILHNAPLFGRIDALYRARDRLGLTAEQQRVLERYHLDFKRAGAALAAPAKARPSCYPGRSVTPRKRPGHDESCVGVDRRARLALVAKG